ncbi:MAG: TM0996/MTH895 family glutaredoxin-like protein [Spirochaetales bacterium]|nr:TM0996/MTH895 family glutaredoxin-like protein [Spirochaetales bacterium]
MKIQILGSGCPKCQLLEKNAREAVLNLSIQAEIEKVTDTNEIINMGVMMTPALTVDGIVKSTGKVLSTEKITGILRGRGKIGGM